MTMSRSAIGICIVVCLAVAFVAVDASNFGSREADPTVARGEAVHGHIHIQPKPPAEYMPFNNAPRRVWTKEEADEFFGHPSVQSRPEFKGLKDFLYDNGFHASKLELRYDPSQGYYFVATKPATMLEELLSVPGKMFFHIYNQHLQNSTKYMMMRINEYFWGPGLESEIDDLARVQLVICLMAEYRNPNSFWAPYLQILQKPVLPFMLTAEERDRIELGRSSSFLQSKNRLIEDLQRVAQAPEFEWMKNEKDLLMWAIATVGSRTFSWGLGKFGNHLVMMPGMDFINHNNDVANHYEYTENQDLRYLIPTAIMPGDELAIAYLPHATNFYLYQEYGFVLPRNIQDHVSISFGGPLLTQVKGNPYDLPTQIIMGYDDHVPYKFLRAVNLAFLGGDDSVTLAAYDALINLVKKDLASFTTTREQDEAALKTSVTATERLIIVMRIEMKRILEDIITSITRDRSAFASKGIDGIMGFKSNRQPSDVYLDEPLRVIVIDKAEPKQ